jgi:phosphoribosylanthranilate isomerase
MEFDKKIKVCGMRESYNIEQLSQLPIHYMGFIFYPPSPRFVGNNLNEKVLKNIPARIKKVGVFVNSDLNEVLTNVEKYSLQCVQLHGTETPDYCNAIREKNIVVIKAFKAEAELLTCETSNYRYVCDYFLFDTPTSKHGGSGIKFDWQMLSKQKLSLPFFLSGGIGSENERAIKELVVTGFYAIDLNSKFEIEPGIKDIRKLDVFIQKLNQNS